MTKSLTVRDKMRGQLESSWSNIAAALPTHVKAEQYQRKLFSAVLSNPKVMQCEPATVLSSVMQSAQLGLDPSGLLGSAYLVPYGRKCQLIPGYRGLIELAMRSGKIARIKARAVFDGDEFEVSDGLADDLIHRPKFQHDDEKHLNYVYAVAYFKESGVRPAFEVMSKAQVDRIRKFSKAGGSGPWREHYVAMALKTITRKLLKWMPLSTELDSALALDVSAEQGVDLGDSMSNFVGESLTEKLDAIVDVEVEEVKDSVVPEEEVDHDPATGELFDGGE